MARLPSLRGLQAFDAVARSGTLAAAADTLAITPSAVSHRIRGLEEDLGVRLLDRRPKGLELTETGRRYWTSVEQAFATLEKATDDIRGPDLTRPLTVSLTSEMGLLWLMPRFSRFRAAHPDIDIALLNTYRVVDLVAGEADMALRYGYGDWPGTIAEPLLHYAVMPVCAPSVMAVIDGLSVREAFDNATTIVSPDGDWDAWFSAAGLPDYAPPRQISFLDYAMGFAAALSGEGILLGYSGYVDDRIASGDLVKPFDLEVSVPKRYHIVYPEDGLADPRAQAFRDWLISERDRDATLPSGG